MRKIIHCDADCFFAAVEMRDDPSLRLVPMAVGGSTSHRGVISTCNYEARRFGVHSAMASGQALKLCPSLVLLPHNMDKYRAVSAALRTIFSDYSDRVEMVSVDEAFLDVSDSRACRGSATLIAEEIRKRVREELGITVSAGVATNKFLAKVASEWRKPDGLFVVEPGTEQAFVDKLPVRQLHGVGKVTAAKMARLGIATCRDLRHWSSAELTGHFGVFGLRLAEMCRGIDDRPVSTGRPRKSLSVERTFPDDLVDLNQCLGQLPALVERLGQRLQGLASGYSIRKAQIKVKFSDFSQTTLERPCTDLSQAAFADLLADALARGAMPVRLLGVGVQFAPRQIHSPGEQLDLFPLHRYPAPSPLSLAQ